MNDNLTRRDFLKRALGTASVLSAPTIISYLGKSATSSDKEFLEIRDGNFYLGGDGYMIKGANYLTRDHPWKMFDEYDPEQINKELEIAKNMGINAVRVPIRHEHATTKKDYFDNFEDFLGIADNHNIKVMPIVLGHVPHRYFEKEQLAEDYLKEWLPEFSDDERILAWDVKNEPSIHEALIKENRGLDYDITGLAGKMAEKIRQVDPNHPITIGMNDTNAPTSNNIKKELIDDSVEIIDNVDFYCFHFYIPIKYFDTAIDRINNLTDKPIVLQEFGLPSEGVDYGSEAHQKRYFEDVLERCERENLNGLMFWALNDHPEDSVENPKGKHTYYFGVLRTDYSKKPAAHVVEQYYKWIL